MSPPASTGEGRLAVDVPGWPAVDIAFERSGPVGAPSLVLLHGLGDDRSLWRHVAPALARRHDVVVVDLPGHGASGPVPARATIEWFAAAVALLIDRLELRDLVLAGLSMGGGVAQYVAIDGEVPLRGLILVSTSPVLPAPTRQRFGARADLAERAGMAAVIDATVERWFTPAFAAAHPEEVRATRATVARTDARSFALAGRANAARDCTDRLGSIACPVLFVAGLDDPADPRRAEAIYREGIPDLRVRMLSEASHLLPVETPDRLLREIEVFIDELPRSVATGAPAR